jgi:hypothetical protein
MNTRGRDGGRGQLLFPLANLCKTLVNKNATKLSSEGSTVEIFSTLMPLCPPLTKIYEKTSHIPTHRVSATIVSVASWH